MQPIQVQANLLTNVCEMKLEKYCLATLWNAISRVFTSAAVDYNRINIEAVFYGNLDNAMYFVSCTVLDAWMWEFKYYSDSLRLFDICKKVEIMLRFSIVFFQPNKLIYFITTI